MYMSRFLDISRAVLCGWLSERLPKTTQNWWIDCVINNLSFHQRRIVEEKGISNLSSLDLTALLRIADRCWYQIRETYYMPLEWRYAIRNLIKTRNTWAHATQDTMTADVVKADIKSIVVFLDLYSGDQQLINEVQNYINELDLVELPSHQPAQLPAPANIEVAEQIQVNSVVALKSDPSEKGVVLNTKQLGDITQYEVFLNGAVRTFYEGQITLLAKEQIQTTGIDELRNALTAYNILNPSNKSLYSLHSARIDFVPYQFRPALKIIQSDSPRLLIADSVGVGKTIEAGLVLKELQARNDIDSVLIICPKPLVAERKWELEMNRFDESFTAIDGPTLRQIISDTNRDGVWPERYRKAILPYSLLSEQLLYGKDGRTRRRVKGTGLLDLEPAPHFDLVIVDEAHHIRNIETYAHTAVRYFCDHADAVLFLTATPLQTGNEDLFTLLNALRPDVVLDPETFQMMAQPNAYINKALQAVRANTDDWKQTVLLNLEEAVKTQWGAMVIAPNPEYELVKKSLEKDITDNENRLMLVPKLEGFHSFHTMITRTRRQDIQDFCIRRSNTVSINFTSQQQKLHDTLLDFEAMSLRAMHGNQNVAFMMSMLTRQAASCIFGLAPSIRSFINRRFTQILDDSDANFDAIESTAKIQQSIIISAQELLKLAEAIPEEDPKFDAFIELVMEKQQQNNNKIIVFSTFRHTLAYLRSKLKAFPVRIAQVDGSTKDQERYELRRRFELEKANPEAIDVMLFTEVGSEGLDYQFCDMMINYDLPWNPMRIEQRIGRIDRRGQKSEVVRIINMITEGTVDAEIYHRCLWRIGVFESSIGECAEILGSISSKIEEIVNTPSLTPEERNEKLSRMADNEILQIQEIQRMEENEKHLFGFDFSLISKELSAADNPWIAPDALESLVQQYLQEKIGEGQYILGEGKLKTLRLSIMARQALMPEKRTSSVRNVLQRHWESYLKGNKPNCYITFDSVCASQNRNAFFLTNAHPLVKQAAKHFQKDQELYVCAQVISEELPSGEYPFAIYSWEYVGYKQQQMLKPVCSDPNIQAELFQALQGANTIELDPDNYQEEWEKIQKKNLELWQKSKQDQRNDAEATYRFRKQSLDYQMEARRRILQGKINEAYDENIVRMRKAELENAENRYQRQVQTLENELIHSDIHVQLLVKGVLKVEEKV